MISIDKNAESIKHGPSRILVGEIPSFNKYWLMAIGYGLGIAQGLGNTGYELDQMAPPLPGH